MLTERLKVPSEKKEIFSRQKSHRCAPGGGEQPKRAVDPRAPTVAINYFEWCSRAGIIDQSSPTHGGIRTGYGNGNSFPTGNRNPFPTRIGHGNLFPTGNGNPFPTRIGNKYSFPTGNWNPFPTCSMCTLKCTICPFSNTLLQCELFLGLRKH